MKNSFPQKAALVGGLFVAISGCTTTYIGQKIEPNGKLSKQGGGVPFVMTRPEYKLNIAADTAEPTKAVYTLTATYVPDASQRFTIALDPGLLVNGKFDLDFGDNGNLTGATSTAATRVVETFGSVVGLALKVSALLDAGDTLDAYKLALASNQDSRCTDTAPGSKGPVKDELKAQIKSLETEVDREVGDKINAKHLRAELVGERLHYQSSAQQDCMSAVVHALKTVQEDPAEKSYIAALKALETAAQHNAELSLLHSQIKAEVSALNGESLQKIADGLAGKPQPLDKALAAAQAGKQFVQLRLAGRFGRFLAGMPPDVWRARHAGSLERSLARCQVESVLGKAPSSACSASRVAALKLEWANTLGEAPIVTRLDKVDVLLAKVPPPAARRRDGESAVEDHIKLREERDKLQAHIDKARTDLLSKNKSVAMGAEAPKGAKVEARSNVAVTLVKKSYVDAVNASPANFKDLPDFVLVLEPDDLGGVVALPTPAGATK